MTDIPRYILIDPTPPKRCHHGLHGTLTLLTFGLWAPVWIISAVLHRHR